MSDCLQFLRDLGDVETLTRVAAEGGGLTNRPAFNSHVHFPPNFSAFDSVDQAIDMAADQGIGVLGTGNYYDYSIYRDFVTLARAKGIFPLFGTEIIALDRDLLSRGVRVNDPGNPGKIYICGKGITAFETPNPAALDLLATIRTGDEKRMATMIGKLAEIFKQAGLDTQLNSQAVINRVAKRHGCDPNTIVLQERHVAQAFQQIVFERVDIDVYLDMLQTIFGTLPKSTLDDAVGLQNEIRSFLMKAGKPCFVPEDFVDLRQASTLIRELGGIVCYPVLADGSNPRTEYEASPAQLVASLKAHGIGLAEFIPVRNEAHVLAEYVTALHDAGIAVVAGTEHNTLDLIDLAPACKGGTPIPEAIQSIFWEGTCVVAAHQYLTALGQPGFEDAQGTPHPGYVSAEDRIKVFKTLGEAVVASYFKAAN
jgi:hypothetical protein